MRGLSVLVAGAAIAIAAVAAGAGLLGFAHPYLDLFNHLQPVWCLALLTGLVLALPLRLPRLMTGTALVGLLASLAVIGPEWLSSLAPREAATGGPTIRLMTHNASGGDYDIDRIAAAIAVEDPDIVALQEYFPDQARLGGLLRERYPYSVRCQGGKRANLGFYSKIPFDREMADSDCPDNARGTQRTAYIIAGFTLSTGARFSVMTTHMDWPYPTVRQNDEFAAAAAAINAVSGPLIVVGDFNSTPWSYAMGEFEAMSGLRRETRSLPTYPLIDLPGGLSLPPFLPIDHVFQRGVAVTRIETGTETGSDHLPVVFDIAVSP